MRRFGPLLLLASVALLVGVGFLYRGQRLRQGWYAPTPPNPLPAELHASAKGWHWAYTAAGKPVVEIRAQNFQAVREPSVFDLTDVELKIFHGGGPTFDLVESPRAQFLLGDGVLRSDAEVTITMGVTGDPRPSGRLLSIRSSGVTFENKTGRADTDQHAVFTMELGEGEADGAAYDPQSRELRLKRNVKLVWRGSDRRSPPMYIESGELIYRETDDQIYLMPWTKFRRETLSMEGGPTVLTLEEGNLRLIESTKLTGRDPAPGRSVEFAANEFSMWLRPGGVIERIVGVSDARLVRQSGASRLVMEAYRLDLSFAERQQTAILERAFATGRASAEVAPLPAAGQDLAETRLLRSELLELTMKPGVDEVDQLATHAPGLLEFLPNAPNQRRRQLEGERLWLHFGSANRLQSFRGVKVATRTDPAAAPASRAAGSAVAPQLTWSDDMSAAFHPDSGELLTIEQWGHFRFEEGARRAIAERGVLDQIAGQIRLTGGSRVWDPAGSTEAESILIDDKSGRTESTGSVRTVREPERPGEEKVRGSADRVVTTDHHSRIRYEGQAVLWQAGNRLSGDVIEIARPERLLRAAGHVVHVMQDSRQIASEIRARSMVYRDQEHVAYYEGGVTLTRPQLTVTSQTLRAYPSRETSEEQAATLPDSGLDRAFAMGGVEIVQTDPPRRRHGTGQQADYYAADHRVVLEGNPAQLVESLPGGPPTVTRGRKLTWQGGAAKLQVDGEAAEPAVSSLPRKK